MRRSMRILAGAAVALTVTACASGGSHEEKPKGIPVAVQNNLVPSTILTVNMVSEGGQKDLLGSIIPTGRKTFRFDPTKLPGSQVHLVGQTSAGKEITSQPFAITGASRVEWDVSKDSLSVSH